MICNKCGAQCPDNAAFCTSCGNYLAAQQQTRTEGTQQTHQNYYQQPVMNPAPPMPYQNEKTEPVTSIGQYILWWLISAIPFVGFILTIVFAVDSSKKNRANFFRAQLIIMAISIGLSILFFIFALTAGVNFLNEFEGVVENFEYIL